MYDGYNGKMRDDQVSCTLTSQCGYTGNRGGQQVVLPVLTPDRIEKRQNGRRFKENGEPALTLTSEDMHGVAIGFNTNDDGTCRTLRAQTNLFDPLNLIRTDSFGASGAGVAIRIDEVKEEHPVMFVQLSNGAVVYAVWYPKYECYVAIRKLTPRECFRLQGWEDEYFERAEFVNSDSQLYKQAGNGVTVNVVELIGRRLAEIERGKNGQENSG